MAAMKSSTLISFSELVVTFLKNSPAFCPGAGAGICVCAVARVTVSAVTLTYTRTAAARISQETRIMSADSYCYTPGGRGNTGVRRGM